MKIIKIKTKNSLKKYQNQKKNKKKTKIKLTFNKKNIYLFIVA